MASVPNSSDNPYQAPAQEIDFTEVSVQETNSKSSPPTRTVEALRETRPWVSLLGGLGALVSGLASLVGIVGIFTAFTSDSGFEFVVWRIPQLATSVAYLVASILLLRYASAIGDLLISGHGDHLDAAIEAQRSFWRFAGISVAIVLLLICGGVVFLFFAGGVASVFS